MNLPKTVIISVIIALTIAAAYEVIMFGFARAYWLVMIVLIISFSYIIKTK